MSSSSVLDEFEALLKAGQRPNIADFLPEGQSRLARLCELVRIDFDQRVRLGEQVRPEDYFVRFVELDQSRRWMESLVNSKSEPQYLLLKQPTLAFHIGRLHRAADREIEALAEFGPAKVGYRRLVKSSPESLDANLRLGESALQVAQLRQKAGFPVEDVWNEACERLSSAEWSHKTPRKEDTIARFQLARLCFLLGEALRGSRRADEALRHYQRAAQLLAELGTLPRRFDHRLTELKRDLPARLAE